MATIPCFMIYPTDRVYRWLRRYRRFGDIPSSTDPWTCASGWHQAMVQIEDGPAVPYSSGDDDFDRGLVGTEPAEWPHDDPRWPAQCEKGCGYAFVETDEWQLYYDLIYRTDDGREMSDRVDRHPEALGAMFWARWMPKSWWGPEGLGCLTVNTPGGFWPIDGPAFPKGGPEKPHAWTRSGVPPMISVTPSILIGDPMVYHGFLTNGALVD